MCIWLRTRLLKHAGLFFKHFLFHIKSNQINFIGTIILKTFSGILSLSNIIFLQFHLELHALLVRSIEAIRASTQEKKEQKTESNSRDSTLKAKVNAVNYIVLTMHK